MTPCLIVTSYSKTYGLNKDTGKVCLSIKEFNDYVLSNEFNKDLDYFEVEICDENRNVVVKLQSEKF